MKVLGIDYSLNGTGLSVFDGNQVLFKKVFTNVKKNYESNKDIFIFLPTFNNQESKIDYVCDTIINCFDYDFVCMEDHIGSYYNWMDGYAIIKHLLRKNDKKYLCVAPSQLKKYAGSGKADKTQMSYYLRQFYNLDFDYLGDSANNIVDATWLAILGSDFYNRYIQETDIRLTKERTDILKKLKDKFIF